jgi:hypothetical protein
MRRRSRWSRLIGCAATVVLGAGILAVPAIPTASAAAPVVTVTSPTLVFTTGSVHIPVASSDQAVVYLVTDEQGLSVVPATTLPLTGGTGTINLSTLGPGYYNLTVGAGTTLVKTSFAVLSPLPANAISPTSPFGIGMHALQASNAGLLPTVAQIGFSTVRYDLKWPQLEQSPGVYTFSPEADNVVNTLNSYGITPLPIVDFLKNTLYEPDGQAPHTPTALQAQANMLSAILTRYPTVRGIEVYNEFNTNTFNPNGGCQTGTCFATMLATSYHQIKADHPNALVAAPSTSGLGRAMPFINDLWNAGGLANLDVVSVHPYTYPAAPEGSVAEFQQLNQSVRDHNNEQTKPIWVTENGWPNENKVIDSDGVDESTTADNLIRSEALALANGVTQYDWYDLVNDGTDPAVKEQNFGLMRLPTAQVTAVSPKPALVTQAVTIRQLAGLAFSGDDGLTAPLYSERFGSGSATTRVMWAPNTGTVSLTASGPVTVTDEYGRAQQLNPSGGQVLVDLTQHPVFVKGPVSSVHAAATPQFTATAAPTVAVGDTTPVTLTVDRRHEGAKGCPTAFRSGDRRRPGATECEATFRFGDGVFTVPSRPGRRTTTTVDLPASTVLGTRSIVGVAGLGSRPAARLTTATQTVTPTTVTVQPHVTTDPFSGSLSVAITNHRRSGDATVSSIVWSLGTAGGTKTDVPPVAPGTTTTVDLPLPDAQPWRSYPYKANVSIGGSLVFAQSGNTGFNPITPAGSTSMPPIDLSSDGKATYTVRPYGGAADLSGTVELHSTADGLRLTADLTDDVFSQKNPASTMYLGDSVQLSATPALPGVTQNRVEFGIARTANGPEVYCYAAAPGQTTGTVTGTDAEVTRTGTVTHYAVTLPWTRLGFSAAPSTPFGISVLANDDDNDGFLRPGVIEWGGGIATSKNTAQTYPAELVTP